MGNIDIREMDEGVFSEAKNTLKSKFPSIVEMYIEDCTQYMNNINEGALQKNIKIIAENAHPLKSSSYSFGFVGLGRVSEEIERTAKSNNDENVIDNINGLLPDLNSAFKFTQAKLKYFLIGFS